MSVKQKQKKRLLRKLLLNSRSNSRLWAALLALCIGTTLLLAAVMIWWNFQQLLDGKQDNDSLGSTFLTISKKVTDENMAKPKATLFTDADIEALGNAPQVRDVGALTSNRFPVYATLNASLGFATEMFLEAVPDRFMDKKPEDWYWQPSTPQVPIILSSEFLNLYNYGFALSKGLPQLSENSIESLAFDLKVGAGENSMTYRAHVVGFSDRITSVLVPQSFIDYCNRAYANEAYTPPSRLIVRVADPSDKEFIRYLQSNNYTTNSEQLRWSRLRGVVEVVTSATGLLALLLLGIGALVFILFIELTIARAEHSLKLLLQIGYSPRYLGRFMMQHFFPLLLATAAASMTIAVLLQQASADWIKQMHLSLPQWPGLPVWGALAVSTSILLVLVSRSIIRAIGRTA
jgi:hypothetical protein